MGSPSGPIKSSALDPAEADHLMGCGVKTNGKQRPAGNFPNAQMLNSFAYPPCTYFHITGLPPRFLGCYALVLRLG